MGRGGALASALSAAILAFGLAGCGGGGEEGTGPTSTGGGSTAGPQARFRQEEREYYGFGRDPSAAQRTAILATLRGYFRALGDRDYAEACPLLSSSARGSLEALTGTRGEGCEAGLAALTPDAIKTAAASSDPRIKALRLTGDGAYAFYVAQGNVSLMQLARAGAEWKDSLFVGTVIAPAHPIGSG